MKGIVILILLVACGDNEPSEWFEECYGSVYGLQPCYSTAGTLGLCVRDVERPIADGLYFGACMPACQPSHKQPNQCDPGSEPTDKGDGQGCYCE